MTVNCFQISSGPQLKPCEYSFAVNEVRQKNSRIWIDSMDADNKELEAILDDMDVQGLTRLFCLESRDHPGFYPMKHLALMVMPVQMEVQDPNVLTYLALVFNDDFLISIRSSNMSRFRRSISIGDSFDVLPDESIAGIIATLLLGLSLDSLRKAARLSDLILALEKHMELEPAAVKIEEISSQRSELLTHESIIQGQLPIIETILSSGRSLKNSETTQEYIRWAATNFKSADRKLEWLEHRIEVLRSIIDMNAQDRTNRRLGRLTILSAIFMPITFLVGIWGMNFQSMPLLSLRYGYLVALGIILLISWGMYTYFHKKGWFD